MLYGAVLVAFRTLAFGIYYWLVGWLFGAQSWVIDMNLGLWTEFTFKTFLSVMWRMFANGIGGARAAGGSTGGPPGMPGEALPASRTLEPVLTPGGFVTSSRLWSIYSTRLAPW